MATGAGSDRAKESLLSAILSLILPGAGQAYNGQVKKGIVLALLYLAAFAVSISATVMFALYTGFGGTCCCLPVFILPLVVLIYAVYDAYEVAEKINLGQPAKDWL
jgi:ABC-type transport system involved in cytochrome c biogenesis permease component